MVLALNDRREKRKKYAVLIASLGVVAVFVWMTLSAVASVPSPTKVIVGHVGAEVSLPSDCASSQPMHRSLAVSTSPQLNKLAQYESVCGSGIIARVSFFVATPITIVEAEQYAADVAAQLHEFAAYAISPVVFFEPTTSSGLVDMTAYRAGVYDKVLDAYFAAIKSHGVDDAMMGMWVPLPEGNLPVWSSVDPADFAGCVTKAVAYQKKHFPHSTTSILLDTDTYPTSGSWTAGRLVSLLPYVQSIPAGLIDSIGLQGFPWSPASDAEGSSNNMPGRYLRTDLLIEAARVLRVKDVWLNTGSFGVKYAHQSGRQVAVSPEQRLMILKDVVAIAKKVQSQHFAISVHLFAENKSDVPEATDWSYWPNGKAASSASTIVFKTFVHDLQAANIPLWLFDTN